MRHFITSRWSAEYLCLTLLSMAAPTINMFPSTGTQPWQVLQSRLKSNIVYTRVAAAVIMQSILSHALKLKIKN